MMANLLQVNLRLVYCHVIQAICNMLQYHICDKTMSGLVFT